MLVTHGPYVAVKRSVGDARAETATTESRLEVVPPQLEATGRVLGPQLHTTSSDAVHARRRRWVGQAGWEELHTAASEEGSATATTTITAFGAQVSLGSVEGVLLTLLLVLPGATADLLMGVLLDKPRARSTSERLTASVLLSIGGLVVVELLHAGVTATATAGDFLLRDLLADPPVLEVAAARYPIFFAATVAAPLMLRWVAGLKPVEDRMPGGWTIDARSLDRARRVAPPTSEGDSRKVRCVMDDSASTVVDGYLKWVPTIGHDPDPGYVLRDLASDAIHWVPLRSVKSMTFLPDD